jgi:feruloyl esterase
MKHRLIPVIFLAASLAVMFAPSLAAADPRSCEKLASLKLPDTTITAATAVPAGAFTPPAAQGAANTPKPIDVPAFCRVQFTIAPAVKAEVWLPAEWNGNFEGVGNGGFAGSIVYPALAEAIHDGYAAASTDTGHEGGNASFISNPKQLEDFGYLAIHEMTVKGKQVVESFYGAAPREAFFDGCSSGGRQAFSEAQRYPEDYIGILAGSPAINYVHLMVAHLAVGLDTLKDEESYIPMPKLAAIQKASVAACDTLDGLKDGLISDPRKCHFDPSVLLCKGADSDSCLTAKQVETVKNIYAGITYPNSKKSIYPGLMPGVEEGWAAETMGRAPYKGGQYTNGLNYMQNAVFKNPNWDFRTWDYAKDMPLVDDEKLRSAMDAMDPDLRAFRDRGAKLIATQGWGDGDVSPLNTINYFKSVVATLTGVGKGSDAYTPETEEFNHAAGQVSNFFRLYMFPGMAHCGGGSGPNMFKGVDTLAAWVEKKAPDDKMIASHMTNGAVDRTRPVCPYPMAAQYTGQGSIDDAANFVCKVPASK